MRALNYRVVSKIIFLFIALAAVLYAVIQLNTGHMNDFWTSLGIGKNTHSLNWCNDRLISFTRKTGDLEWTLKEQDRQWVVDKKVNGTSDVKTLEYLDIEKWLAKYCILDIEQVKDLAVLDMAVSPLATALFNDGTTAKMFTLGSDGIYQINHVTFKSEEFKKGLEDLKSLLTI